MADKVIVLDATTPLEEVEDVHGLIMINKSGDASLVALEDVSFEASKKVGDAVKVNGTALPTMGEVNKSAVVFGGPSGKVLTYAGQNYPIIKDSMASLFWNASLLTWEIVDQVPLPSTSLDIEGGGLSYERGQLLELVCKYFLTETTLTPGETFVIDKNSQAIGGIVPLENTLLLATGGTSGYDQDFRLFTYLNLPVVQPDGRKIMTARFQGLAFESPSHAHLIGIRQDNTVVPLIIGNGTSVNRDVQVQVSQYKYLSLSLDVETSAQNPTMTLTYSQETDSGAEEDAIKNYIDKKSLWTDWAPGRIVNKDEIVIHEKLLYRALVGNNQMPTATSPMYEIVGGGGKKFVEVENHGPVEYSLPVEGEFIFSTDFIRVVPGMQGTARGYGDGSRPFIEGFNSDMENPVRIASFPATGATTPNDTSFEIDFDGYIKAYNNRWQSGDNYFVKLSQVEEITREDVDMPKGVASHERVQQIYDNKGGEPVITRNLGADAFSVADGEYWRWTAPIEVKAGDLIENVALGDAGVWSVGFSTEAIDLVPGSTAEIIPITVYVSNGGTEALSGRILNDGFIVGRTNQFFGNIDASYIKVMTDKMYVSYADIADVLANIDAGASLSALKKLSIPEPKNLIRVDFKTASPLPTAKGTVISGEYTYNDNAGTIFKKYGTLEVQGSSSAAYVKKNWTFAFFNDAELSDSCKIRLGKLVAHDEFVFKSNYIDATHSRNIVCNRIWEDMIQSRQGPLKRENERAKGFNPNNGALIDRFDTGALCHVEGYPAVFYVNGEFYGLGTFNLGKKRDNYDIASNNQNQIQIAADDHSNFNLWQGEPIWEIRRPSSPDGSFVSKVSAWFSANALTGSAFKDAFPTNHDLINAIDYMLLIDFVYAYDCFSKNLILTSWDGVKFFFTPYDLDSTLGLSWEGREETPWDVSCRSSGGTAASQQFYQKIYTQFNSEVRARYNELKEKDVLTVDNVYRHLDHFARTFGMEMYQMEFEKWPNIPSNNPNAIGNPYGNGGFYSSKAQIMNWIVNKVSWMDAQYS